MSLKRPLLTLENLPNSYILQNQPTQKLLLASLIQVIQSHAPFHSHKNLILSHEPLSLEPVLSQLGQGQFCAFKLDIQPHSGEGDVQPSKQATTTQSRKYYEWEVFSILQSPTHSRDHVVPTSLPIFFPHLYFYSLSLLQLVVAKEW